MDIRGIPPGVERSAPAVRGRPAGLGSACLARCLVGAALLATAACGAAEAAAPVRIVASFYPIYIAALNVVGGTPGVELANLTKPFAGCLHDYQLAPDDLVTLGRAKVFVVNGAGMESFLDKVVGQFPGLRVVDASEGIATLKGAAGGEANPHVWVSVSLAAKQVTNIVAGLSRWDPVRAGTYQRNGAAYVAKLEELGRRMHESLQPLRSRDIVTFHEAFPYFAAEFGLRVAAVVEREPGSEPSARELAETIRLVRRTGVKALFAEPQYSAKAAEAIAAESGARVFVLDPVVTGPAEANAYLEAMERNRRELRRALE